MSAKSMSTGAPKTVSPLATAFILEEGQLAVSIKGFNVAHLIDGDILFVTPDTPFSYWAEAEFTKLMYVSGGDGLDVMLMKDAFYPRSGKQNVRRGIKI